MMYFVPWTSFTIDSPFSPDECRQKLGAVTGDPPAFSLSAVRRNADEDILFQGRILRDTFRLNLMPAPPVSLSTKQINFIGDLKRRRQNYVLVIRGDFYPAGQGTRVTLRMRLHLALMVLLVFWVVAVGSMAASAWPHTMANGKPLEALWPLVIGIGGLLNTTTAFSKEVYEVHAALARLFGQGSRVV